jgi:uncharacterized Zn finger protein
MAWYDWPPYVPVAVRRQQAAHELARLRAKGRDISPVTIEGRTIARSFWGKAWCDNLERYSRLANRLPRGRTYVRNGAVMDLQLSAGAVTALVSGSALYRVSIRITPLSTRRWKALVAACAGQVGSLVELLQGKFSRSVMETLIRPNAGLFPSARDITFECSCPDAVVFCKHVAAALYGVGARLDTEPELFFRLRNVDQLDLLTAASRAPLPARGPGTRKRIADTALAEVFGIELDAPAPVPRARASGARSRAGVPSSQPTPVSDAFPAGRGARPGDRDRPVKRRGGGEPPPREPRQPRRNAR